jgi:hypothetical protein
VLDDADRGVPQENWRLDPSAQAALGDVTPELAWLWVGDMVYHAADQYQPEAQALAEKLNLDMDFASLDVVLAEMNPVQGINELHYADPSLNLQNLIKQPPLKVLESVIQMLHSDRDQATINLPNDSTTPSTPFLKVGNWTNPRSRQSRAETLEWLDRQVKTGVRAAISKSRSNSNTAASTPVAPETEMQKRSDAIFTISERIGKRVNKLRSLRDPREPVGYPETTEDREAA